ncbi:MAG: L,D-transpeptidase [Ilumatobacteraceae bacterium]
MRLKLGKIVTLSVATATLTVTALSGTTAAQDAGDGSTTSTTTPDESSTSTTTTTTPPTTTTTTPPPLVVELPAAPFSVTPSRGTQAQVTDTLPPPPTTTTTTTTTTVPSWVLPANSGSGRRVVYSKSKMRVWTVESNGSVSKTHLVSGRRTYDQPLPGAYRVFSRSSFTCNIDNPAICWRFMVRFTKGPDGDNIGFHEIPTNTNTGDTLQSLAQLGQALSGGCVRQAPADAAYMWDWAPIGTQVVVLG